MYSVKKERPSNLSCYVALNKKPIIVFFRTAISLFLIFISFESIEVHAADITLSPSKGSYPVGKAFSVDVYITNNQDSINAVSASLNYDSSVIELQSISKSGSIITMWAEEPTFSNATGKASMEGVVFNPGFSGASGKIVSLNFRAKRAETGNINIVSGSVLSNDGEGTNVVRQLGSGAYTITLAENTVQPTAPAVTNPGSESGIRVSVSSPSYPDQQAWYNSRNASFSWTFSSLASSVRVLSNSVASASPTKTYTPAIKESSFAVDKDGIQYMHVQARNSAGWGAITHYKFQIDTQAPQNIQVSFPDVPELGSPTPLVKVEAEDTLSGLASVEFVIDGKSEGVHPINEKGTYMLKEQSSGKHKGFAYVRDKAGNMAGTAIEFDVTEIRAPKITNFTKTADVGNELIVSGTTYPSSTVEILYTNTKTEKTYVQKTTSLTDGTFTLQWMSDLPVGVYEMRARAIISSGEAGAYSPPGVLVIEQKPYFALAISAINWLAITLIMIITGFCVFTVSWYSYFWFGRWRKGIDGKLKEAENTIKMNSQALRGDMEKFYISLSEASKTRQLTAEEKTMMDTFKKRLDTIREEIEKKIEQSQ